MSWRGDVRPLPDILVSRRRRELCALTTDALLRRYASLPGRTDDMAARTQLTWEVLVDVIIWTEARPYGLYPQASNG